MAINPAYTTGGRSLFSGGGGGGGGAGWGGIGAGAVGSVATGNPLPIILAIAASLFGGLFGKKDDPMRDATDLRSQMDAMGLQAPYRSPYLPQADKTMFQALLNQMDRTSNWGWPEGKGMDTSFIQEALQNIPNLAPPGLSQAPDTLYPMDRRRG